MSERYMFKNRYGDTMSFEEVSNDTLLWRGSQSYERYAVDEMGNYTMVDPSGGPYISKGQDIGMDYPAWKGRTVDHLQHHDEGYLIICK